MTSTPIVSCNGGLTSRAGPCAARSAGSGSTSSAARRSPTRTRRRGSSGNRSRSRRNHRSCWSLKCSWRSPMSSRWSSWTTCKISRSRWGPQLGGPRGRRLATGRRPSPTRRRSARTCPRRRCASPSPGSPLRSWPQKRTSPSAYTSSAGARRWDECSAPKLLASTMATMPMKVTEWTARGSDGIRDANAQAARWDPQGQCAAASLCP
mmetsp:Transcript_69436/g.192135  ORF Transcript_69436/g.192135 Transcript_69436/m.192135 type:complete len:208 (-) Transcript_69436:45-668(-)